MEGEWEFELLRKNPPEKVRWMIEHSIFYSRESKEAFLNKVESAVRESKERLCGITHARKMLEGEEKLCLFTIERGNETLKWVKELED